MDEGHRHDFHGGADDSRIFADDDFTARVLERPPTVGSPPTLDAVVERVCRHYEVAAADLDGPSRARRVSEARGVVGWLALATGAATPQAVALRFRSDPTTLSRIVSRVDWDGKASPSIGRELDQLKSALAQA